MINSKLSYGMVPSDVLVKTAIEAALADLKKNPWLLDYVFNWFANDDLTVSSKQYGQAEKQQGKKWFLDTEIYVSMNYRADDTKFPLISISLQSSTEERNRATLGDIDTDVQEDVDPTEIEVTPQVILAFTPASFDSATGVVTLPADKTTANIFQDMILVDSHNGVGYPIIEVTNATSFKIPPDITADFTKAFITPIDSFYVASLESSLFNQTFKLACFAMDSLELLYLNAIVEFIICRYKQELLEARGFDLLGYSGGPILQYKPTGVEMTYVREITFNGYVRQYWPKLISGKIQGIKLYSEGPYGLRVIGAPNTPKALWPYVQAQAWFMEHDTFDENE